MLNILNKSLYLVLLSGGIFLIFKNNQDLNNLQFCLIFFMFICMTTIIFLPIIKIDFIGKLPLIYLVNLYFLICYVGVFFFDKDKIFSNLYDKNDHAIAINTLFIEIPKHNIAIEVIDIITFNYKTFEIEKIRAYKG